MRRAHPPRPGVRTLALRDEMEAAGGWLFRWRGVLPLALVGLMLLALRDHHALGGRDDLERLWGLGCLGVSLLGLALRVLTIGHSPRGTSGRNTHRQRAEVLNTTGLYSVVRHPLYVGNFLMALGVVLVPHAAWLVLVYALLFALYYERIMLAEEAFLRDRFADAFEDWAARTPAFLPNPLLWRPAALPFSARNVLRREYNGLFAVVAAMALLQMVGSVVLTGAPQLAPPWPALLGLTASIWLVLRTLKRHTALLDVDGR